MDNSSFLCGVIIFLLVLCKYKSPYSLSDLQEWIENFLESITTKETIEEDEVVELEEVRDMITSFVVENQEIFSKLRLKDE